MSVPVRPGVYVGTLRHRRTSPVAHAFTYPIFMVLLDIDRIPELMAGSMLTSYNRWNWASFHEADHLGDPALPLRKRLELDAASRGLVLPDGPIFLLTHLRYLGYCFNPVSFFYCYDAEGTLRLMLAAVNNTFGGSHNYWLEPGRAVDGARVEGNVSREGATDQLANGGVFRARAAKSFYVSPFMPAAMEYRFAFTMPNARLVAQMSVVPAAPDAATHAFDATLQLGFRPWTPGQIRRALLRHPLMTAHVVAGIHWEALRLWWKGLPIVPRPSPNGVYPGFAAHDGGAAVNER